MKTITLVLAALGVYLVETDANAVVTFLELGVTTAWCVKGFNNEEDNN